MLKWLVLGVAAFAVSGCCLSNSGCYVPAPGVPTAWDGTGTAPGDGAATDRTRPRRVDRSRTEIIVGPLGEGTAASAPKPYSSEYWAQKEAAGKDADARLSKQMMICRGCATGER